MTDGKNDVPYTVETVPPPPGESDAYNAPTKVGPVTAEAWIALMKQASEPAASSSPAPDSSPLAATRKVAKADIADLTDEATDQRDVPPESPRSTPSPALNTEKNEEPPPITNAPAGAGASASVTGTVAKKSAIRPLLLFILLLSLVALAFAIVRGSLLLLLH